MVRTAGGAQRPGIVVAHMEMAKLAPMGTSHAARPTGDRTGKGGTSESRYRPRPFGDARKGRGGGAVHGDGWRRLQPLTCPGLHRRLQRATWKPCGRCSGARAPPGVTGACATCALRSRPRASSPRQAGARAGDGVPRPRAGGSRGAPSALRGWPTALQQETRSRVSFGLPEPCIPPRRLESAAAGPPVPPSPQLPSGLPPRQAAGCPSQSRASGAHS